MTTKSPAFQFYVQDFLIGVRHFTAEEVGAYVLLLCEQWDAGFVPNDEKFLKKITGISSKKLQNVLKKFSLTENGFVNGRLERERDKSLKFKESRRENAMRRWSKGDASALHTDMLDACSSSSTSSSIDTKVSSNSVHAHTPQPQNGGNAAGGTDLSSPKKSKKENSSSAPRKKFLAPELSEVLTYFRDLKAFEWHDERIVAQANRWFDYYTANGWRVGRNPMKDWKAAVRNWIKNDFDNGTHKTNATTSAIKPQSRGGSLEDLESFRRSGDTGTDEQPEFSDYTVDE